jgi:hypothetical protein
MCMITSATTNSYDDWPTLCVCVCACLCAHVFYQQLKTSPQYDFTDQAGWRMYTDGAKQWQGECARGMCVHRGRHWSH